MLCFRRVLFFFTQSRREGRAAEEGGIGFNLKVRSRVWRLSWY